MKVTRGAAAAIADAMTLATLADNRVDLPAEYTADLGRCLL
jgi:hypothetical protein